MSLATETLEELKEMSNKELLDFICNSNAPECVALVHERRSAFWWNYRNALAKLQHVVLNGDIEAIRDKIGEMMDQSLWIFSENAGVSEPLGGLIIERLRIATAKIKRLRTELYVAEERLYATEAVLRIDDEIMDSLNGTTNKHRKKAGKRYANSARKHTRTLPGRLP